jgi:hypothetical protein
MFWTVYARGPGEIAADLVPGSGQLINVIPFGEWRGNARYEIDPGGRYFRWSCSPGDRTVGAFLQIAPADAPIHVDVRIDGQRQASRILMGASGAKPVKLPFDVVIEGAELSDPVIDKPFVAEKPGFYLFRHIGKHSRDTKARAGKLDAETVRRLQTLGYLR